jgi:hypothetical protein
MDWHESEKTICLGKALEPGGNKGISGRTHHLGTPSIIDIAIAKKKKARRFDVSSSR